MSKALQIKELQDEIQTLDAKVAQLLMTQDRVKVEIIKNLKKLEDKDFTHDISSVKFTNILKFILNKFNES